MRAPKGLKRQDGQSRTKSQHPNTKRGAEAGEVALSEPLEMTEERVGGLSWKRAERERVKNRQQTVGKGERGEQRAEKTTKPGKISEPRSGERHQWGQ